MKLNRENIVTFVLLDTAFLAALWYFVIPNFLGETLNQPTVKAFYYFAIPLVWIGIALNLVLTVKQNKH